MTAHSHRARHTAPDGAEQIVLSVAALLRREGRGPHAADGQLRPRRCYQVLAEPQVHPLWSARKAAAATCVLFAAGTLFGASVLDDAISAPQAGTDVPRDQRGGVAPGDDDRTPRVATAYVSPIPDPAVALAASAADIVGELDPVLLPPRVVAPAVPAPRRGGPAAVVPAQRVASPPIQAAGVSPPSAPPAGHQASTPPASSAQEPAGPKHDVKVSAPDVDTPVLEAAGVEISPGRVDLPDVSVSAGGGTVAASTSDAEVVVPDVEVSGVDAGPVGVTRARVTTPDVAVSGGRVALGAEPDVDLPEVTVSETEIETPDVEVAGSKVALPDVELPETKIDADRPVESVTDTVEKVGSKVLDDTTKAVGGLLGGDKDDSGSDQPREDAESDGSR